MPEVRLSNVTGPGATKHCLEAENEAHTKLEKEWSQFTAAERAMCVGVSRQGQVDPVYTELATCLEIIHDNHWGKASTSSQPASNRSSPAMQRTFPSPERKVAISSKPQIGLGPVNRLSCLDVVQEILQSFHECGDQTGEHAQREQHGSE